MNTRTLIAAAFASVAALATSGAAMAQIDAYPENGPGTQVMKSELTRAEVKAQVLMAQADGTLQIQDQNYPRQVAQKSTLTRAEVMAELRRPQLPDAVIYGDTAYPYESTFISQRTRDEVRAETFAASAQGKSRSNSSQN
jgi:hypothetical protein